MKKQSKPLSPGELILNTDLVKIYFYGAEYKLFIKMSQGGTIEHEPFLGNLTGLVSALQLATEICAGKFFPRRVVETESDAPKIEGQMLQIEATRNPRQ